MHHELTVWSRGIIMDKEARDVSTCIATAARSLGYYAENVSDYVDDPDRTNCLVRRYARFADEPILDRFVYENPHPDWVVLVEETIIKAVNFFHRTHPAQGVLVINSARDPQYLLKFLPENMLAKLDKLVVVDATGLAEQRGSSPWMFVRDLSELAFDRMSTEGAVERHGHRPGHRRAADRRPGGGDRRARSRRGGGGGGRPRRHAPRRREAHGRPVRRGDLMSVRGTHVPEHLRLPIAGVTPPPTEKDGQRLFPTGNFRFYRPVYRDKTPPCNHACPTGEQIQKYLDHVKHDRYLDGYLTITEDNPMPSVTGRVCYHPCETACNRAAHDEPIGIRGVERFLGDFGLKLADNPIKKVLPPLNGKKVAIVGSGPGGLGCAYHLRRKGYASVIFEALDTPGGMLRAGIPAWHLPEEILDAEIAKLLDLGGIEIQCGVRVGAADGELTLDELARRYDAVFLALGQDVGRRLDADGAQARGVIGALEFLRETGLGRPVQTGKNVLVIGGGNTASDAARSAIRLGGETAEATIVSLEAEDELLIVAEDLAQAREEGVRFRPQTALVRVLADDEGNVRGAVLGQASLHRDSHGAVTPQLTPGTEVEVPCDTILVAIGQVQVLDWLPADCTERGLVRADEYGRIPHPSGTVFTGGDVMRGPSMVVDALGDGKRAARDIDRVLSAEPLRPDDPVEVMPYEKLNTAYFRHAPRTEAPLAPAPARRASQVTEVTLAYSREQAVAEADRCMSCGVCNGCDNCYIVCPDVSVMRDTRENGHYSIRTHYCKGCLVCVQECPTGCLERVPEMDFDEPDAVVRMETAFAPYEGAHAEQAPFTRQLIEDAIAEYDAARTQTPSIQPNGGGVTHE